METLLQLSLRAEHAHRRAGYVAQPRVRKTGTGLELAALRADGTEVPVEISLGFVDTEDGRLVVATARDLTESLQSKRLIEEYNDRLSHDNIALTALNKELEAFSYSVSHDLRAPLRAIDGFSQVLLEDYADHLDDTGRDYATRVRNGARHMGTLIDDLLTLSRITRADLIHKPVDLGEIVRGIVSNLHEREPEREFEAMIADDTAATGDPNLLHVALDNLLNNAWKFTAGRSPARIEFGRTEINGETAYYVRDNGVGFDMAYAGKLFGAFQRLHDAREFPGTGIGLAIVQRVINKHGGRVWAEAETGKGASFYFTL